MSPTVPSDAALASNPQQWQAAVARALAFNSLQRHNEARAAFSDALKLAPPAARPSVEQARRACGY